jgi:hypothetical protein
MIPDLLQRLRAPQSLSVKILATDIFDDFSYISMELTDHLTFVLADWSSYKATHFLNVLLCLLDWNIVSTPIVPSIPSTACEEENKCHARAIDEVWRIYSHKPRVKSLFTLCIQKTRARMNNLHDSSFESLGVPARICRALRYHDVADDFCEALRLWPQCETEWLRERL